MEKKFNEVTEKRMGADIVSNSKSEIEIYKNTVQNVFLVSLLITVVRDTHSVHL